MVKKVEQPERSTVVLADKEKWSVKSKQSVAYQFNFVKEYRDIEYNCWCCGKQSVFTAEDQKYAYETKKAYIDQKRVLCSDCHEQAIEVERTTRICEKKWAENKTELIKDVRFLTEWLGLLDRHDEFTASRSNTAIKNMLRKLLNQQS